jgi:hypothetical protein
MGSLQVRSLAVWDRSQFQLDMNGCLSDLIHKVWMIISCLMCVYEALILDVAVRVNITAY